MLVRDALFPFSFLFSLFCMNYRVSSRITEPFAFFTPPSWNFSPTLCYFPFKVFLSAFPSCKNSPTKGQFNSEKRVGLAADICRRMTHYSRITSVIARKAWIEEFKRQRWASLFKHERKTIKIGKSDSKRGEPDGSFNDDLSQYIWRNRRLRRVIELWIDFQWRTSLSQSWGKSYSDRLNLSSEN